MLERISGTVATQGLAPVPSHFWAVISFLRSLALLAPFTLVLSCPYSSSGRWLFFLAPGSAAGLGATAPGADVSAASWAAWPGWWQPGHTLSPEHHHLRLPALSLRQPFGEEAYTSDENWTLASLLQWFSASGHLPRLEPQCWVCDVVESDARCLFKQSWAVHTLGKRQEVLSHAALMLLNVFAFELLWYPYGKPLNGFLQKLPGYRQKRELRVFVLPNNCPIHATQYL